MMRNGKLYPLHNAEHPISEEECLLLPTPVKDSPDRTSQYQQGGYPLMHRIMKLLPTPMATDVDKHGTGGLVRLMTYPKEEKKYSKGDHRNLPTPTKHLHQEYGSPSEWKRAGPSLITHFIKPDLTIGERPRLHPPFVEWMMGFPIGWLNLEHSEIVSCLNAQNGLEEE